MLNIVKNDTVKVIGGNHKGKVGKVLKVFPKTNRVIVEKVRLVKRHTKPNPNLGQPGGIVEREASLHISNVAIFNSETNKADRVGIEILEDGAKKRVFKSNGQDID